MSEMHLYAETFDELEPSSLPTACPSSQWRPRIAAQVVRRPAFAQSSEKGVPIIGFQPQSCAGTAMRDLPPRLPTIAHNSLTRCVGGSRLPATAAKAAASSALRFRPNAALRITRQVCHDCGSSSAAPRRAWSQMAVSIVVQVAVGPAGSFRRLLSRWQVLVQRWWCNVSRPPGAGPMPRAAFATALHSKSQTLARPIDVALI